MANRLKKLTLNNASALFPAEVAYFRLTLKFSLRIEETVNAILKWRLFDKVKYTVSCLL